MLCTGSIQWSRHDVIYRKHTVSLPWRCIQEADSKVGKTLVPIGADRGWTEGEWWRMCVRLQGYQQQWQTQLDRWGGLIVIRTNYAECQNSCCRRMEREEEEEVGYEKAKWKVSGLVRGWRDQRISTYGSWERKGLQKMREEGALGEKVYLFKSWTVVPACLLRRFTFIFSFLFCAAKLTVCLCFTMQRGGVWSRQHQLDYASLWAVVGVRLHANHCSHPLPTNQHQLPLKMISLLPKALVSCHHHFSSLLLFFSFAFLS